MIGRETELLRSVNDKMKLEEKLLDRYCRSMQLSLKHTQQDPENMYYAYVTRDDLTDCFGDSVVLTLRNFDYYETSRLDADMLAMARSNGEMAETMADHNTLKLVSYNTSIDVRLVTDEGHVFSKEALEADQSVRQWFSSSFSLKFKIPNRFQHSDDASTSNEPLSDDSSDRRAPKRPTPPSTHMTFANQKICSDDSAEDTRFLLAKTLLTARKRSRRNFDAPSNEDSDSSESRYS